jgi:hypothetical protein
MCFLHFCLRPDSKAVAEGLRSHICPSLPLPTLLKTGWKSPMTHEITWSEPITKLTLNDSQRHSRGHLLVLAAKKSINLKLLSPTWGTGLRSCNVPRLQLMVFSPFAESCHWQGRAYCTMGNAYLAKTLSRTSAWSTQLSLRQDGTGRTLELCVKAKQ